MKNKSILLLTLVMLLVAAACKRYNKIFETELLKAVFSNNISEVEILLRSGINVNALDKNWDTPLILASSQGNLKIVQFLLDNGADINFQNLIGETALITACIIGHFEIVELLIKKGATIDTQDYRGKAALSYAIMNKHLRIIKILLNKSSTFAGVTNINELNIYCGNSEWKEKIKWLFDTRGLNKKLIHAIEQKNLNQLKNILKKPNSTKIINAKNDFGLTPLFFAICYGNYEIVQYLLNNGADGNAQTLMGETPLIVAINSGLHDLAKLLLTKNVNVNLQSKTGWTALMSACFAYRSISEGRGNSTIVEMLLNRNANPEIRMHGGASPLLITAIAKPMDSDTRLKIMKLLIYHGAKVNIKDSNNHNLVLIMAEAQVLHNKELFQFILSLKLNINGQNSEGETPLYIAAKYNNDWLTKLLIEKGANVHIKAKNGTNALMGFLYHELGDPLHDKEIIKSFYNSGINLNATDNNGKTALMYASGKECYQNRQLDRINTILSLGANINMQDKQGKSALKYAVLRGSFESVKLLIAWGVNTNLTDKSGWSALGLAIMKENSQIIKLLRDKGAKVSQRELNTIHLFDAIYKNNEKKVKELISAGVNINAYSADNFSLLMTASIKGNDTIVKLLLTAKADINAIDEDRRTAFYWACNSGNIKVMKILLSNGANINQKNIYSGETPLMSALKGHRLNSSVALWLIKNGADVNLCDNDGDTPLLAALYNHRKSGFKEVIKLLLIKGANIHVKNKHGYSPFNCVIDSVTGSVFPADLEIVKLLRNAGAR